MIAAACLVATILCLLGSGFFSGTEMGLYCLNRVRLRLRAEQKDFTGARSLLALSQDQQETVLGILLGSNLSTYLLTVSATAFLTAGLGLHSQRAEFYVAAVFGPLAFVLGDVVPKNWFQAKADQLMYKAAGPLRLSLAVLRATGVLWLLRQVIRLGAAFVGQDEDAKLRGPRGEVIGLLREGAAEGALTAEQAEIVERVMNLSTVRVGAIMIPRRDVATVPVTAGRQHFEHIVRSHNYSRMPVLDRENKTVVGIVNVYDVLADESPAGVEAHLQEAVAVRAQDSAAGTLVQLRRAGATMAIVTDPRRGFVGIVTLKDVIEEIFGELPAW